MAALLYNSEGPERIGGRGTNPNFQSDSFQKPICLQEKFGWILSAHLGQMFLFVALIIIGFIFYTF